MPSWFKVGTGNNEVVNVYESKGHRKILFQDGGFVLAVNYKGDYLIFHCHCDHNGPEYWASCFRNECHYCGALVPDELRGFQSMVEWKPGKTEHGLR